MGAQLWHMVKFDRTQLYRAMFYFKNNKTRAKVELSIPLCHHPYRPAVRDKCFIFGPPWIKKTAYNPQFKECIHTVYKLFVFGFTCRLLRVRVGDNNFEQNTTVLLYYCHIDGLVQYCSNSIANALELLQSCTKLSVLDTAISIKPGACNNIHNPIEIHVKPKACRISFWQ